MSRHTFGRAILECIYPSKCGLCGRVGQPPICDVCRSEFVLDGALSQADEALDGSVGVYVYEGRAAQAVQRLKFERITSLGGPMAAILAAFAQDGFSSYFDTVVPVPIHVSRRRRRGFNQADLLASAFDKDLVQHDSLRRIKATRPQVGLTVLERATNLVGAFECSSPMSGRSVLLVDDVTTSGATAKECAAELKRAGAAHVYMLAFARG